MSDIISSATGTDCSEGDPEMGRSKLVEGPRRGVGAKTSGDILPSYLCGEVDLDGDGEGEGRGEIGLLRPSCLSRPTERGERERERRESERERERKREKAREYSENVGKVIMFART